MSSLTRFSKGLFAAGVLAGSLLGMSGCGPDYALFKVDVSSSTSPRNDIEECRMTITDENGKAVQGAVDSNGNVIPSNGFLLKTVAGPPDSSGNATLLQGCQGAITNPRIGTFSYSSSRTTGTLTFQVDALNSASEVVQTGKSDPIAPKAYPPEVQVTVTIKKP